MRRQILTPAFEPGSYLDETELAESYQIFRAPLREALRQLAGEGYVVIHANRRAQVVPMTLKTLRNFFVAALMIYASVTRLAAEHATPAQIMRLNDTKLLFRAAISDKETAQRALMNERFHAIIGEMADNEFLMPSMRRLLIDHTRIVMTFYSPRVRGLAEQRAGAADQHDVFIILIESGDAEAAARLGIAHWELSRADIESFSTPASIAGALGQPPGALDIRGTS